MNGPNKVRFEIVNTGGKVTDTVYVNWFKLSYHDSYVAEGNRLDFSNPAAGTWRYQISGYTSSAIEVYDVTDMGAVQRITDGEVTGAGAAYTISFGDTATASASRPGASRRGPAALPGVDLGGVSDAR